MAQPRPDLSSRTSAWKPGASMPLRGSGRAHVIDHDLGREAAEHGVEIGMVLDVEQELHVPAQLLDALGQPARHAELQAGPGGAVDAETANAGLGQAPQLIVGDVLADQRDAAQPAGVCLDRIDDEAVVVAVEPGLHQHAAREARGVEHREIVVEIHRRRRIEPRRGVGILVPRAEHVRMAVCGVRRHHEVRPAHVSDRRRAHGGIGDWRPDAAHSSDPPHAPFIPASHLASFDERGKKTAPVPCNPGLVNQPA